jgi:NIPSNAP
MTLELRTYVATPGRLPDLLSRFRDHTVRYFLDHGMASIAYWSVAGQSETLIYLIRHTGDPDANWESFRADARWIAAKAASIEKGEIVASIASVFVEPTDFSPFR